MKSEKEKHSIMTCLSERVEARFYIICQNRVTKYRWNATWKIINLIFSMPIYLSFPLLKTTTSREERSTCYTVAVPLHRSTISAKNYANFLQNLAFESLFHRYFIYSPSYQEMLYCTNLNLAVKLKTIVLLCQVTSFLTDPKLVWIIGNLRLDKFVYHGGWGVLIYLWKLNFL